MKAPTAKRIRNWAAGAALLAPALAAGASQAIDWQLSQSVSAAITYTDNIDLEPDRQAESGFIPSATYSIAGTGQGGRTLFATDARISVRGEPDDGVSNMEPELDQRITALGRFELVRDRFFVDGLFTSFQELIDANSGVSASQNSSSNSTNSVTTFGISPVYQEKLGNWADTQLSYEHTEVLAEGDNDDASFDRVRFSAVAGNRFNLWRPTFSTGWASYRERLANPNNSLDDVDIIFVELDNRIQVSRNYAILGLIGYNEIDAPSSNRDLSGVYWNIGVLATPTPRTQFDIRVGQRYDDFAVTGSLSHQLTPNLLLRANATQDVGTALVRSSGGFQRLSITQLQGGLAGANGLPSGFLRSNNLDDGISTQQGVGLAIVGTYGRSTITAGSQYNNRSFDDGDDATWTNRLAWSRQLSRQLTFDISVAYRFVDERNQAETHTVGGRAGVSYQLGPRSSVFADISRTDRFSSDPNREYVENAATVGGRLTF